MGMSWKLAAAWLLAEAARVYGWTAPSASLNGPPSLVSSLWKRTLLYANQNDNDMEEEECYDLCESDDMPVFLDDVTEPSVAVNDDTARMRLEMKWGLDENEEGCDLEQITTCGEMCEACQGRGVVPCRFCGGSTALLIGNNAISCPVCTTSKGVEACKSCRGSGYIAQWTLSGNESI